MDYTRFIDLSSRLIGKWGRWFPVEIASAGTYDPITDSNTETLTQVDLQGVLLEFNARDIDGTVVQVGDKRVLLEAGEQVLDEKDKIRIITHFYLDADGEPVLDPSGCITYATLATSLSPISIVPLEPGGDVILYKIHARG